VRTYFAPQPDPYAGGDLDNAQRIGKVVWGLLVVLLAFLVPLNPPTEAFGAAGWVVAGVVIAGGLAAFELMRADRVRSWDALLAIAYGTVVAIGLLQWLAGGVTAPFRGLLLLPVLIVAATHPPRRIAPFMGLIFVVLIAPFLYDAWDATRAEGIVATFVIWCALAVGASLLMTGVRIQRVMRTAEGQEARAEARIDSLTGLPNRRAFDEVLNIEVARARRFNLPLSLVMIDVVHFKGINDDWSYAEGDRCLQDVAEALQRTVRQPDACFRWGGDEFALILAGTREIETDSLAGRLDSEVSLTCLRPDGTPIRLRFATAELRGGLSPRALTEMAGVALTATRLGGPQKMNATSST
jgi:diguanylate cyclase (GGDEF)-like protein